LNVGYDANWLARVEATRYGYLKYLEAVPEPDVEINVIRLLVICDYDLTSTRRMISFAKSLFDSVGNFKKEFEILIRLHPSVHSSDFQLFTGASIDKGLLKDSVRSATAVICSNVSSAIVEVFVMGRVCALYIDYDSLDISPFYRSPIDLPIISDVHSGIKFLNDVVSAGERIHSGGSLEERMDAIFDIDDSYEGWREALEFGKSADV